MKDSFSGFHPIVNFVWFALVLVCSMSFLHPVCLAVSLAGALIYCARLNSWRTLLRQGRWMLPLLVLTAAINPLFNHRGITILTYLPSGNPLTLESVRFGVSAALLLIAVLCWLSCLGAVMTSDKFIWLFGRIIPALSLLLSMALRFVPEFTRRLRAVHDARRTLAAGDDRRAFRRVREALAAFSILVTWSLESAIETADSMRARGYGLRGRSAFSIYRFARRDAFALAWIAFCGVLIVVGWAAGLFDWRYFPSTSFYRFASPLSALFPLTYLALCLTPVCIDLLEDRKWNSLRSKI